MNERHLLPNEIDLLLDGEAGFSVRALRAHLSECPDCAAQLTRLRTVVDAVEALSQFAPDPRFADRVMAQVQVLEPWHVAALEFARRFVPRSKPMRVVMAATASVSALALTSGAVWLAMHSQLAAYSFDFMAARARGALTNAVAAIVGTAVGQGGLQVMRSAGLRGLVLVAGLTAVTAAGAVFALRALTSSSRRVRE